MKRIDIYDTTLRDGAQREGISLACSDKVRIASELDRLGVSFIEGGWPGSNPKDVEFFQRARDIRWQHAAIAAFGATRRAGILAEEDPNLQALIASGAPVCTVFGKSSVVHVREVLRVSLEENLAMISDTVAFLVRQGRRVIYDAEHFFDGAREDAQYALETLCAAHRAGAESLVLCDTNGGTLPWEVSDRVMRVLASIPHASIGIHAHDDAGCAVANSLAAVRAGATHVQGTINGYGERCGNANLTAIIPSLQLKLGFRAIPNESLVDLGRVSRFVAESANLVFDEHAPYVGRSAFAHKGGVHVAAIKRSPRSYEHVEPSLVGNRTRVVVSELSGRANVQALAEANGVGVDAGNAVAVLDDVKAREAKGFAFESAEASALLMLRRAEPSYEPLFELVDYKVIVGRGDQSAGFSDAAIKVRVRGVLHHTAAEGNGPVSALDAALRKALVLSYPEIERIHLEDYKVRILDSRDGTGATTRVLIDHGSDLDRWTTVGASPNIVEASILALADGIEHGLWLHRKALSNGDEKHRSLAG